MRSLLVSLLVITAPSLAAGQAPATSDAPRLRTFTLTGGTGNAMGWIGMQGEKYLGTGRVSLFGGLGYTPELETGDAHGVTVAAGVRGYTPGFTHRGFVELSLSQLAIETACFDDCRRLYGPGVQLGYQLATRGGFTFMVSAGIGYAPSAKPGEDEVGALGGIGVGYTWRR